MDLDPRSHPFAVRAGVFVLVATTVVTLSFIGLLAAVRGAIVDPGARLPFYVLVSAVAFVGALVALENPQEPGVPIITTTIGIGVVALVVAALAGEGLVYASANAGELLTSQLVIYVVAAALICTAVVYWSVHHWREFVE